MDARAVADKYISNDGGGPPPDTKVLRLTSNELRWLKVSILRGGWVPYRSHDREDAPTTRSYRQMQDRGLISGPPWRITQFGREAIKRAQLPKCNFIFEHTLDDLPIVAVQGVLVLRPLADIEKEAVLVTLRHFKGRRGETAKALGISRRTLQNRLRLYRQQNSPPR